MKSISDHLKDMAVNPKWVTAVIGDEFQMTMEGLAELKRRMSPGMPKHMIKDIFAGSEAFRSWMKPQKLQKAIDERLWLRRIEALRPGDACEVQCADGRWELGTVRKNGGSYYWRVFMEAGHYDVDVWIEQVRLPGQVEAWPR